MNNTPTYRAAGIKSTATTVWYVGCGTVVRLITVVNGVIELEHVLSVERARKHYADMLKPDSSPFSATFHPIGEKPREEVLSLLAETKVSPAFSTHWV